MLVPTRPPLQALQQYTQQGTHSQFAFSRPGAGQAEKKMLAEGDRFVTDLLRNHPFN